MFTPYHTPEYDGRLKVLSAPLPICSNVRSELMAVTHRLEGLISAHLAAINAARLLEYSQHLTECVGVDVLSSALAARILPVSAAAEEQQGQELVHAQLAVQQDGSIVLRLAVQPGVSANAPVVSAEPQGQQLPDLCATVCTPKPIPQHQNACNGIQQGEAGSGQSADTVAVIRQVCDEILAAVCEERGASTEALTAGNQAMQAALHLPAAPLTGGVCVLLLFTSCEHCPAWLW